jgi:oligopeptide transport system substrate-binding protein
MSIQKGFVAVCPKSGYPLILAFLALVLAACSTNGAVNGEDGETTLAELDADGSEAAAGLSREVRPAYDSEDPITLDWNLGGEPETLDPALATDRASLDSVANLFVGLTRYDPATGAVQPYLATSWDVSSDGLIYTFHLRNDIHWVKSNPTFQRVESQGPVTAFDVEYAIKRALNPSTGSGYAYALFDIKNATAIHRALLNGAEEDILDDVGVVALDDTTLQFVLERPAGYFPSIMGMWVAKPVPRVLVEAAGEAWTDLESIWTNGPYLLTDWVSGQSMRFEKNPFWFAAGDVQIEVVRATMIIEPATEYGLFQSKDLDSSGISLIDLRQVLEDPVLVQRYVRQPVPCTYYYGFTTTKPPFDDVRVRTAFSAAIDRAALVATLDDGQEIPATTFAPPGTFGAPTPGTAGLGYDPNLAVSQLQDYLTEKGLESPADLAALYDITLGYNTGERHARVAEIVQEMWLTTLGVEVRLEEQDWTEFLETTKKTGPVQKTFHIFRMGWCADYPDESNWLRPVFHYLEGANRSRRRCSDPNCAVLRGPGEFDRLVEQGAAETDPGRRLELYAQAEDILAREEVPAAFLFHHATSVITQPWLLRDFPTLGGAQWSGWRIDWPMKKANR